MFDRKYVVLFCSFSQWFAEENDFVTAHSRVSLSSEGEDMKYA